MATGATMDSPGPVPASPRPHCHPTLSTPHHLALHSIPARPSPAEPPSAAPSGNTTFHLPAKPHTWELPLAPPIPSSPPPPPLPRLSLLANSYADLGAAAQSPFGRANKTPKDSRATSSWELGRP